LPDGEIGRWCGEEEPVTWKRSIQSLVCNLGGRVAGSIPRECNHDCVSERDENNPALRRISLIPRPRAVKTVCTIACKAQRCSIGIFGSPTRRITKIPPSTFGCGRKADLGTREPR